MRALQKMTRLLDHQARSRTARSAQRELGWTVEQVAAAAGVSLTTAYRFLGLDGERSTKDPRSSTTFRIMAALGYECEWRRER